MSQMEVVEMAVEILALEVAMTDAQIIAIVCVAEIAGLIVNLKQGNKSLV